MKSFALDQQAPAPRLKDFNQRHSITWGPTASTYALVQIENGHYLAPDGERVEIASVIGATGEIRWFQYTYQDSTKTIADLLGLRPAPAMQGEK